MKNTTIIQGMFKFPLSTFLDRHRSFLCLACMLLVNCQSGNQPNENTEMARPPVTIANSEQFPLYSRHTRQEYKIYVRLPMDYSVSDTRYPVIYGMDADIGFSTGAEVTTLLAFGKEIPEMILVGVAYGAYPGQEGNKRTRDFTPTADSEYPGSGGAEPFFYFLRDELIPAIDSMYRTDPTDRTLSGASLSGLFSLYVLFQQPGTFSRYKISSPSVWWDDGVTFEFEREHARNHTDLQARVFISVGGAESTRKAWGDLVTTLENRGYESLQLTPLLLPDTTHRTACFLAGIKGVASLFKDYKLMGSE